MKEMIARVGDILMQSGIESVCLTGEELVRCKNCKYSCDYTDIFPDRAYKCIKNRGYHNDNWFCADGERQDDNDKAVQ